MLSAKQAELQAQISTVDSWLNEEAEGIRARIKAREG